MSNHTHHQNKTEQIYNKAHGAPPFHYDPYQESKLMESKDDHTKVTVDHGSIQLRAYQIYREKGGSALDNWLEAERCLRYKHQQ